MMINTNATEPSAKADFTVGGISGRSRTLSMLEWKYIFNGKMTDPGLPPYVELLERSSRRMISAERSQIHTTVRSGQLQNPRVSSFSRQQVPVLTLKYGKQAPMAITGPQRLGITIMHRWYCSIVNIRSSTLWKRYAGKAAPSGL